MKNILQVIGSAIVLVGALFALSLLLLQTATLGPIENIHGIPYPTLSEGQLITEELAHADLYLGGPTLGKKLYLVLDFEPGNTTSLAVGLREDSFWLSYGSRQEFYSTLHDPASHNPIYIPLADKLQEADQSLDLMFFAQAPAGETPTWELRGIDLEVQPAMPTYRELRNYAGSILKRERAL